MITVVLSEEAEKFTLSLDEKPRNKLFKNIDKIEAGIKNSEWFKKLSGSDGIWEIRTRYQNKQIRLLAFWDKTDDVETLVICTHGFIKKTAKTPKQEIIKAEKMKKEYFEDD